MKKKNKIKDYEKNKYRDMNLIDKKKFEKLEQEPFVNYLPSENYRQKIAEKKLENLELYNLYDSPMTKVNYTTYYFIATLNLSAIFIPFFFCLFYLEFTEEINSILFWLSIVFCFEITQIVVNTLNYCILYTKNFWCKWFQDAHESEKDEGYQDLNTDDVQFIKEDNRTIRRFNNLKAKQCIGHKKLYRLEAFFYLMIKKTKYKLKLWDLI